MYIIIAGCGRVGSQLAESLSFEGHDVVVIDRAPDAFRRLGRGFNGLTMEGIAIDEEVLLEAGLKEADAFAAVTNADNTNLMASGIAARLHGVPKVISRLYNPDKELTFFKMGIDYICSTTLMTERIRDKMFQEEDVIVQQDRVDAGLQVVELTVGEKGDGLYADSLNYGVSSFLVLLLRDNRPFAWDSQTRLSSGDRVIVTLRKEGWNTLRDCFGDVRPGSPECRPDLMPASLSTLDSHDDGTETRVVVAGCSQVGSHLAYELSIHGYNVTIVDDRPELFRRLPPAYRGKCIEGVVFDEKTLREAGIEYADAFVALSKFDNTNLMASEVARHIFGVPHVMARLFNPDKEATYRALNLKYVCGTRLLAQSMFEFLLEPEVRVLNSCLRNMFSLVEFACPHRWNRRTIGQVKNRTGAALAHVVRRNSGYIPHEGFVLRQGDSITAVIGNNRINKLEKLLRKH